MISRSPRAPPRAQRKIHSDFQGKPLPVTGGALGRLSCARAEKFHAAKKLPFGRSSGTAPEPVRCCLVISREEQGAMLPTNPSHDQGTNSDPVQPNPDEGAPQERPAGRTRRRAQHRRELEIVEEIEEQRSEERPGG